MNKVLKGLVAVAATAAMAVAGFAGASTAMADDPTGGIAVEANDTHTYSVYQIFTGTYGWQRCSWPELQDREWSW